jgi:hypothetical protein
VLAFVRNVLPAHELDDLEHLGHEGLAVTL